MIKNKAVVCYYQEKYGDILNVVLKRHSYYAKKCQADFVEVILPDTSQDPQMDKFFHISESLEGYEQYLVIDVDILIRKDSPNIFSLVGKNKVGIYNEGATFLSTKHHEPDDVTIRWYTVNQLVNLCNLPKINHSKIYGMKMPFTYYNSGVVIFGGKNKDLYKGFDDTQKKLLYECYSSVQCSEQALVNYCIINKKANVYNLPVCFNQMTYNRCSDYLNTSYFSHYAGMSLSDKRTQIFEDNKEWEKLGL